MQKSANRCTSTGKVTKKTTKKMGTPSPPAKKKKTPETGAKQHEEATTSTATARSKSPAKKKPIVVAKKAQAGRKDLKATATPKKKCPKKPAVKRAPAKKVVRTKAKTKSESKPTDGEKVKRKTTAKNKATNSKLKKDAALPISSEAPTVKKSGTVRATGLKSRAKGKVTTARANKPKTMKKEAACKVVQAVSVVAEVSSQGDTPESTPSGDVGAQNKLERRDTLDTDRKVSKKDDKKEEPMDKKQTEEINCKETIAKLLKKANKSITPKRKREVMKIKSNTTMVKKAKVVRKPKKAQTHAVKVEPEEVKDQEAIDAKKVTKKPAKPKKKANVKEEKVEMMKEEIKEGAGIMDKQEDVVADECVKKEEDELNTDDSTTSDEMTLSLLKHSTDQPTCSKMVDDKGSKGKKVGKVKSEPSSESDQKYKPPVKRKASPKVLQDKKKKMMMLKKAAAAAAKDKPRSDSDQKSRKLKLYSWWTGPKRHRVASLNALAKVHCLYENESRGALYDVIKRSPVAKESNSDDPEHEPSVEPTVEASTRTLRSVPGLRGVAGGGYWEMHDETSSSSSSVSSSEENSNDDSVDGQAKLLTPPPSYKQKQQEKKQAAAAAAVVAEDAAQVKEKPVKAPRKRRNRTELMMDLKDMVVRKRMASLNASAMLAASYSVEKKPLHCVQTSESSDTDDGSDASVMTDVLSSDREPSKRQCYETDVNVKKEEKLIEVRASPNKKVAVIVNQDTDVTITGVYVNSTTRSTHHEGYCTVAGMQYRISATSHTQTAATAVATETLLHSEHGAAGDQSVPCKSYTPLGALSSMQPPGSHVPPPQPPPHSPTGRRHGCPSAFTAPPTYGPPPPHHHHHPPGAAGPEQPPVPPPPTYIHGYYQPAGPLITAHHGHTHPPPLPVPAGKVVAVAAASLEASPSPTPPPPPTLLPPTITTHQPPPSSTGTAESSDNEVIITSASSGGGTEPVPVALPLPAHTYRYTNSGQYPPPPPPPPGYTYSAAAVAAAAAAYPPSQYYHHAPPPPATYAQQQQQHFHHDICYPGTAGYAASYIHPKTYTTFRRYLPAPPPPAAAPQYYQTNAAELYPVPPPSNATSSQVVSAGPSGAGGGNSSSYQQQQPQQQPPPPSATLVESYVPPPAPVPPTIVEPYPPPPPPHYYTGYSTGPAPPPACYTHSPPTRNLAFIDAAYQSCPCPMQSCPKNVHTGPLTGDGKRSSVIAKESSGVPLPPVALALPLEPASVAGPPSPARGSAGMPPPPSPAGATYQPTPITSNNNSNNNSSSSCSSNSSSTIGVPPILTPKWEDDQVLLMEKPTSTECTTTATTQVLLTSSSSTSSSTSTTDKRNKMARVGKQMARNNIMLLMCHNTPANSGENPVKREVESPEEIKTLVQSIAVPSTPPPTPTPSPMLLVSETKRESPESITELAEKLLKAEQQPQEVKQSLKNETYYAEEVQCVPQVRVMRRHSTQQQQRQQHQQCKVVKNSRRKSLQMHDVPELKHEENAERAGVKRKLTDTTTAGTNTDADADPEECKTQPIKKQKPNTKTKSAVAAVNGSYKDLIKRDKCVKVADVKPPERKFLLYKTPKIMLGRAKKTAKRKTTVANKDEPVSKRLKTSSRPLVASNLHNSKQNKQPPVQSCANVLTERKPCQKRAQVSSKVHRGSISNTNTTTTTSSSSSIVLTNVDRTIESVVTQCSTSSCDEHTTQVVLRTSNSAATGAGGSVVQARGVGSGRSGASKRKNKSNTIETAVAADLVAAPAACIVPRVPRKSLHMPRWSNGWSWDGVPFQGKVFLNSDEALVVRRCYPAMRHTEGDIISPRDCVLLKAGPRKIDLPFVAKVAALWEDEDGEMMMSLLWYYRPEHTDQGRRPVDRPDEVFASRHKDTNSVACIEDKCYVLTFNEYCRYRKSVRRLEEGLEHTGQVVPMPEGGTYHRQHRQPPAPLHTAPELVFFCRQVYDFRQKRLMKNPS